MSDSLLSDSHEPIITLTTDFGEHDPFVGIMKGVILSINPRVRIVDLCHHVPAHHILEASFLLGSSYRFFPAGTIHVVVVDPGVGSQRRPILAQGKNCYFIAPDNGVLSYSYQEERADLQVFHLTRKEYFRSHVSQTFHGRDIFAPVSAWLSTGLAPHLFGPRISDYQELKIPEPRCLAHQVYEFQIIHIDAFGNLITSIGQQFFSQAMSQGKGQRFSLEIASQVITCLQTHYAALDQSSRIGAIFGSTGNLEIFANQASASKVLRVSVGDTGRITFLK